MTIKKWETPQIINLGVEETETPSTTDYPHVWTCPTCGKGATASEKPKGSGLYYTDCCDALVSSDDWAPDEIHS